MNSHYLQSSFYVRHVLVNIGYSWAFRSFDFHEWRWQFLLQNKMAEKSTVEAFIVHCWRSRKSMQVAQNFSTGESPVAASPKNPDHYGRKSCIFCSSVNSFQFDRILRIGLFENQHDCN